MNPSSGNKGVNHLAQVLAGQSKKDHDRNSALVLDFGEIMDDYSLQTNTFSIPIPVEDYHVCRPLAKPGTFWRRPRPLALRAAESMNTMLFQS